MNLVYAIFDRLASSHDPGAYRFTAPPPTPIWFVKKWAKEGGARAQDEVIGPETLQCATNHTHMGLFPLVPGRQHLPNMHIVTLYEEVTGRVALLPAMARDT